MDYKLKEIILNYFTTFCAEEIQTAISKYENVTNGDEKIREKLATELDRLLLDTSKDLPDAVNADNGDREFLSELLTYIYDSVDTDELVTYIDWE